jgi:hypothetical protein
MALTSSPLVSIGIPTYNRPQRLKNTLSSLVKQTYSNLEIIISDNCSPGQETEQVVREFMEQDSRIKYFRQEQNVGMFYNFKFAFDVSEGEYFAWAADDDARSENYIEECLRVFQEHHETSNLVLVNSFSQLVDPDTQTVLKTDYGCTTVGLSSAERIYKYLSTIYTEQAAVGDLIYGLIDSQALRQAMELQPNALDWDHIFLATLALMGEFHTIPKPLMSSGPGGMSTLKDVQKMAKIQLIEKPLYIKRARWVRAFFLQSRIWNDSTINLIDKLKMSFWINRETFQRFLKSKFSA